MRLNNFFQTLGLLALFTAVVGAQDELPLVYPEEIFPELQPLLQSASRNAPELRARAAAIEEREGNALVQRSQRNSSLYLNSRLLGGYEQRFGGGVDLDAADPGEQTGRPVATLDGSLWWEKPIFAWGNLERYARMGELGVEAAQLDYAESTRVHLNEVRATFLRWQMAAAQLRLHAEQMAVAEQLVGAQRRLLEAGRASEQQVLELEVRLLEDEEVQALYEREQQYFRNRLSVLVGDEATVAALVEGEIPSFDLPREATTADWRSVLQNAVSSRPALERERRYAQVDAVQAEVVSRLQRPMFSVVGGLISNRIDAAETDNSSFRVVGYVGLQVRWNIFDGRRSQGEQMAALARQRARQARLEAAEARALDEGARLVANLRYELAQADSRTRRAELLKRRLDISRQAGAEDRLSPLQQLELRLEYLGAEQRILQSKTSFLMTMSQLAALVLKDPVANL